MADKAPTEIPFPVSTAKDKPERGGIGRMVNALMEQRPDGSVIRKRAPGLKLFASSASGSTHCRGMILDNDSNLIVVYDNFAELVTPDGVSAGLGSVIGTDIVTLAKNKNTIPDVVCVSPQGGATVLSATGAPIPYPDANIGDPNSVCFGDGYFFFTYGIGQCQASGINSTSLNPLDKAVTNSSSTTLLRGVYFAQTLFLFTEATIEAWTDNANPTGFPFSRSAVIAGGLIATNAVAGWESNFTSSLIFVGSDNIVKLMNGYSPTRISTSDIERRIQNVKDKTTLRASVYMSNGHAIWQLTCTDFTLFYDITNSVWLERDSFGQLFSRIECGCFAFGNWLVGDVATGNIGIVDEQTYDEYGDPLTWKVRSLQVNAFPQRTVCGYAGFNFIVGVGVAPRGDEFDPVTQYADEPSVMISWSDDGGATFKMPLQRRLGAIGENERVVSVLRTGQTSRYGRVWQLEVSDPVYVGLIGGQMQMSA